MHEWSLAYGVINSALEHCSKEELKEIRVQIGIGELQQIEIEIFKTALDELVNAQKKCKIEYSIREKKAVFKCRKCGNKWSYSKAQKELSEKNSEFIHFIPDFAHSFLKCPSCNSPDFEVLKGRGVSIESIKGKK